MRTNKELTVALELLTETRPETLYIMLNNLCVGTVVYYLQVQHRALLDDQATMLVLYNTCYELLNNMEK